MAKRYHIPVVAFAGVVSKEAEKLYKKDFKAIVQISKLQMESIDAIRNGKILLEKAAKDYFTFFQAPQYRGGPFPIL